MSDDGTLVDNGQFSNGRNVDIFRLVLTRESCTGQDADATNDRHSPRPADRGARDRRRSSRHASLPIRAAGAATVAIPVVPVVAGAVSSHDVPIYLRGVGTVIAYNTVLVRSQIQGQITKIAFIEGQTVHAGDLLAQIDPRPYQAQLDQVTATRDRDQAQLKNAQANLGRYTQLGDKGWATPQLIDTQTAQVAQLESAIKADEALIEAANVQLGYTSLTSPINGITGVRQVDVGNIIHPPIRTGSSWSLRSNRSP